MNNPYSHLRRKQDRRANSVAPPPEPSLSKSKEPGLNGQFLMSRRDNILTTGYNNRKNKLEQITRQNKQIYVRINSQKASYSRDQMFKFYESSSSISRRLSQSKISKRNSSSRSSLRSSQVSRKSQTNAMKQPFRKQKTSKYEIQAKSISVMKPNDFNSFKSLFPTNENTVPKEKRHSVGPAMTGMTGMGSCLPPIRDYVKKPTRKATCRMPLSTKNEGGLLHKIAEEMFGAKRGREKGNLTLH